MSATISALPSATSTTSAASKSTGGPDLNDFLKIMIKELQQQDPFEPMSSKDLVDQIGQINSIQSNMELSKTLKDLALNQSMASAGNMIGKMVEGINGSGDNVSGLVVSVRIMDDKIYLELDTGDQMLMDNVTKVFGPQADTDTSTDA